MPSRLGLGSISWEVSLLRVGGTPLKALQPENMAQSSNTRGRSGLLDPAAARGSRVLRERAHISCHSNDSHLC